ncbi:hypothetical protein [Streptomyces sp. 891-h]|nr:hypothetical protein [Streptomyces sp. 891-h]
MPHELAERRRTHSVPVLLSIYARCVSGWLQDLKKRIEAGGDLLAVPTDT